MMNFCTLFDSNYISKGLALYRSLEACCDDFTLYVMAMDEECARILGKMQLTHMVVDKLDENMSAELTQARSNRSRAEFCWTCGSYSTACFIEKYDLPEVVYLDSDLMFFSSPKVLLDELHAKNASVGLSPHFIPYNASGKYCVQFCYFKNDDAGRNALRWWKEECLKWCYSQMEDGKYGDQKYLDYMPGMFPGVCDIENRGAGMAYWNEFSYKYSSEGLVYAGKMYPYVFFHYSGFKLEVKDDALMVEECYPVGEQLREYLVRPYVDLIRRVYTEDLGVGIEALEYKKSYSRVMYVFSRVVNIMKRFRFTHRIIALFFKLKYSNRRSPYSEKSK